MRSEGWRYIRYADGSEELYDETADPYEWTNLAGKPEHAKRKCRARQILPNDRMLTDVSDKDADKPQRKAAKAERKAKKKQNR